MARGGQNRKSRSPRGLLEQLAQPRLLLREGAAVIRNLLPMRPAQPVAKFVPGVAQLFAFGLETLDVPIYAPDFMFRCPPAPPRTVAWRPPCGWFRERFAAL